jgi:hypothetical protein
MMSDESAKSYQASGRQKVRVFLEGREVPNTAVSISHRMNAPAMANIELVPLGIIKFIRPRTQVHVFVRDSLTFGDDGFYLAFEGEVMGRSMIKRHDGRAFRITAFDYSSYWDDAKAFLMNPNFLVGKAAPSVLFGEPTPDQQSKAAAGQTVSTAANSNSLMIDYLTRFKDKNGGPDIVKGIAEVVRRLASVNEFYRAAYERLRIIDRIFVQSSSRLGSFLKDLKVEEFLSTYTGAQGGMMSLRQMLMQLMTLVFHESVTVPFPSLVNAQVGSQKGKSIAQFIFIPDTYLLPPPKCNVIFPNQQLGFEFDEDFRAAPTRYGFRASFPVTASKETLEATYPIQYYPRAFADFMGHATGNNRQATTADLASMLGPSQILKSKDGRTYGDIFYGAKAKDKSVGVSYAPTLREADFLTNEESLKGIYYDTDLLMPAYTALVRGGSIKVDASGREIPGIQVNPKTRNDFIREIGAYLFFKKRYAARQVSASIMFNPFLVPGFNALFIDDSEAGQSFIAKVQSVTHQMTNQGFSSVMELAYGRDFDEIDIMNGGAGEPPLPSWFDDTLFGYSETAKTYYNQETKFLGPPTGKVAGRNAGQGVIDETEVAYRNKKVINPTVFPTLSTFYQALLGCDAVTGVGPKSTKPTQTRQVLVTNRGAAMFLRQDYLNMKTQEARDAYVRKYVRRPVVSLDAAFDFVGAEVTRTAGATAKSQVPDEYAKFTAITDKKRTGLPGRFDGKGYSDETILKIRRDVIDAYIAQLRTRRGVRG